MEHTEGTTPGLVGSSEGLAGPHNEGTTMAWTETITKLTWLDSDPPRLRCACCGGEPSLLEVDREGTVTKMVNCDRAELRPGDDNAPLIESCPMYSPSIAFNKATRREAVNYWNMVQARLVELRGLEALPA